MTTTSEGKRCPKCDTMRDWADFNKHKNRSDGHSVWCRSCLRDYAREYNQRPHVKERQAQQSLARYHRLSADDKAKIQARRYSLGRHLLTKYQLTLDGYQAMLDAQGGTCAICDKSPDDDRRLAVDHDHACCPGPTSCGECVRGLLCTTCNVWLGFYENQSWIDKAAEYLARREAEATAT